MHHGCRFYVQKKVHRFMTSRGGTVPIVEIWQMPISLSSAPLFQILPEEWIHDPGKLTVNFESFAPTRGSTTNPLQGG
jgi:hypothetical protein